MEGSLRGVQVSDAAVQKELRVVIARIGAARVHGGRGQPDLSAQNHGGGPAPIRDGGFPTDVLRLAPPEGQSHRISVTGSGDVTITNDGVTILKEMDIYGNLAQRRIKA